MRPICDLPILRGSYTDGLNTSRVNWQGFYFGGQGGYGSSDENFNGSTANMIAALLDHNVIQEMGVSRWNSAWQAIVAFVRIRRLYRL